ncbi:thiamine pyrophosphate-binding protein [Bailinhaonella thermotolerans]|uniref:Thiamine pyrophosphate-binding protein n=1 Tax=Bailinhaonella thermotolerans TaxID=1070861 RepID=A0A3A4AA62_9ACTN|nr:thiamine pyrophosphate-binding protein [Bailinhaonella thermotolerans]RJL23254.1 thiamine pyrophosphate-binding protein [Bailinhaonella thermotolerans]
MTGTRTAAHFLLDRLVAAGVSRIFGVPGGPMLTLLNVLDRRADLDFVLAKHEEGAVFMAEGHAQATGELGVACVTAGPGTTHALTAAASATSDWAPVLVLGGQVPTGRFGQGGLQDASGGNWSIDAVQIFGSACRLAALITSPDQLPALLPRAIRTATAGLPGAVYLGLPADVLDGPEPDGPGRLVPAPAPRAAARSEIRALAEAIEQARRPIIFAGQGAKIARAGPEILALAELRAIPVTTTIKAKGVFPEDHPLSLGVFGNYGGTPETHEAVLAAEVDLILVLGSSLGEVSTAGWDPGLTEDRVVAQIDADPLQLGRTYPVDHPIAADVRSALRDLLDALPARAPTTAGRPAVRPAGRAARNGDPDGDASALLGSTVAARLDALLPGDALLFLDAGNALCWAGEHYRCGPRAEVYCSMNVGCMGYSIPASIGAKLARPDRPVVALAGDAAFAMGGMEIHTAAERGVPVIWIVLNNQGNAMVANIQEMLFGNTPGSMYSRALDAAAIARGLGARAVTVSTAAEFDDALTTALERREPWLIDARVDGSEVPWALRRRSEVLKDG